LDQPDAAPSPELFLRTITAFQQTAILRAALQIELFAALAGDQLDAAALAQRCGAAERGVRILCDALVALGFLTKDADRYAPTLDTATFLDPRSPAYLGAASEFYLSPMQHEGYDRLAEAVEAGSATIVGEAWMAPENPIWVTFARAMAASSEISSRLVAELVEIEPARPFKVLDIAAGHGLYGLALAAKNPNVEVVAVDWPNVLEVATENAAARGVADRHRVLPGSAFDVDFGDGYDLVLLAGFLHHFDTATCEALFSKVYAALDTGGRAVTVDFIPTGGKVSPPSVAIFAVAMLATTLAGDVYTFGELESFAASAGFTRSELHRLEPAAHSAVISYK